jgi:hypothetical protein
LDEPEQIEVTIFGDPSLGSQVYDGYIIFRGISGGMIAVAVKVKAEVSNIVEGQPVPARQETGIDVKEKPTSGSNASTDYNSLSRNTIIILLAAAIVLIGLLLVAISLRRR